MKQKRWTRHGSTRYLWTLEQLERTLIYVRDEQGEILEYTESPITDEKQLNVIPLALFITFTTYGTWLHGDDRGSVDRDHNIYGTPHLEPDLERQKFDSHRMKGKPFKMEKQDRIIVLDTIKEVCQYRKWHLHAAHIRPTHVHIIVSANKEPEKIMTTFKSYASRALNQCGN